MNRYGTNDLWLHGSLKQAISEGFKFLKILQHVPQPTGARNTQSMHILSKENWRTVIIRVDLADNVTRQEDSAIWKAENLRASYLPVRYRLHARMFSVDLLGEQGSNIIGHHMLKVLQKSRKRVSEFCVQKLIFACLLRPINEVNTLAS